MKIFENIFSIQFNNSHEAIQKCQKLANSRGFSVRIRTSKSTSAYLVCSKEGKADMKPLTYKKFRGSDRCNCNWRIVLYFNPRTNKWEFRPGRNMIHNHSLNYESLNPLSLKSHNQLLPYYDINYHYYEPNNIKLPSIRSLFPSLKFNSTLIVPNNHSELSDISML